MAQGLAHGHGLFVASADTTPDTLLQCLPSWRKTDGTTSTTKRNEEKPTNIGSNNNSSSNNDNDDRMKIAWRYQHLRKIDASTSHDSGSTTTTTSK
jgi:hypothetical protein